MRPILLSLALALLAAPAATAGERADMSVRLGESAAAAPTSLTLHLRYKAAGDPEAKPSPIRMVALRLPEGTGIPFARYPACDASDQELQLLGRGACPPGSRFGDGSLTVITGFGAPVDPLATEVTLFNMRDGILELVSDAVSGATLAVERLRLEDGWLVGRPAVPPGGPPDFASGVRDIDWSVPAGYFTTPPVCPPAEEWISHGRFTFEDGVTVHETAATPCTVAAAAGPRRLVVRPRRVRAGRTANVEVRLPTTARCRAGATVAVAGRTRRTNRRGRVRLRIPPLAAGRHAVTSRLPGCAPRAGWLTA